MQGDIAGRGTPADSQTAIAALQLTRLGCKPSWDMSNRSPRAILCLVHEYTHTNMSLQTYGNTGSADCRLGVEDMPQMYHTFAESLPLSLGSACRNRRAARHFVRTDVDRLPRSGQSKAHGCQVPTVVSGILINLARTTYWFMAFPTLEPWASGSL